MLRLPHDRKTRIQFALVALFVAAFYFGVRYAANRIDRGHDFLELKDAIARGDLDEIEHQLRASPGVNIRNPGIGESALHVAVRHEDADAIRLLMKYGANVNARDQFGRTPLHFAMGYGVELAKLLLDYGADVNLTDAWGSIPLHGAAESGDMELILLLIGSGSELHVWADGDPPIGQCSPAVMALRTGHSEIAEYILFEAGKGDLSQERLEYLLDAVVQQNGSDLVRRFIDAGADPNATVRRPAARVGNPHLRGRAGIYHVSDDFLPVVTAVSAGSLEALQTLVELGAMLSDDQAASGIPILGIATMQNAPELVAFLLDHGLDPNHTNSQGETALHTAARLNTPESARVLIERGADINACNNYGITPLYVAVESLSPNVLRLLLAHGADPTIADTTGASPVALARQLLIDAEESGPSPELKRAKSIVDLLDAH